MRKTHRARNGAVGNESETRRAFSIPKRFETLRNGGSHSQSAPSKSPRFATFCHIERASAELCWRGLKSMLTIKPAFCEITCYL